MFRSCWPILISSSLFSLGAYTAMSRVRLIFSLFLFGFLFAGSCAAQQSSGQIVEQSVVPVRQVAVMDFDSRAVADNANAIYGSRQDLGKRVSQLLGEK